MADQVWLFLEAVLLGAALGAVYDVFRILRLAFPNGRVLIFLEDMLYFALVGIVSFSFVLLQNGGVLRAFLLAGELLGAVLYFFSLGVLVMKAAQGIIRLVRGFLRFLFRIFVRPLIRLFRWIFGKCRALWKIFCTKYGVIGGKLPFRRAAPAKKGESGGKISRKNHKKHLQPPRKIVYNTPISYSGAEPERRGRERTWRRKRQSDL